MPWPRAISSSATASRCAWCCPPMGGASCTGEACRRSQAGCRAASTGASPPVRPPGARSSARRRCCARRYRSISPEAEPLRLRLAQVVGGELLVLERRFADRARALVGVARAVEALLGGGGFPLPRIVLAELVEQHDGLVERAQRVHQPLLDLLGARFEQRGRGHGVTGVAAKAGDAAVAERGEHAMAFGAGEGRELAVLQDVLHARIDLARNLDLGLHLLAFARRQQRLPAPPPPYPTAA